MGSRLDRDVTILEMKTGQKKFTMSDILCTAHLRLCLTYADGASY